MQSAAGFLASRPERAPPFGLAGADSSPHSLFNEIVGSILLNNLLVFFPSIFKKLFSILRKTKKIGLKRDNTSSTYYA